MTTSIFYTDAHPEDGSVDGIFHNHVSLWTGGTWAGLHDAATSLNVVDNASDSAGPRVNTGTDSDKWTIIYRWLASFETQGLPDGDIISGANISLTSRYTLNTLASQSLNIVSATLGANSYLAVGDYDGMGTTKFCDTPLTVTTVAAGTVAEDGSATRHTMALNAAGIASISKTAKTPFGFRMTSDIDDSPPTWGSDSQYGNGASISINSAEGHSDDRTKLTVTHAAPPSDIQAMNGVAVGSIQVFNGITAANGEAINGITF
jgi:hypothetical protein